MIRILKHIFRTGIVTEPLPDEVEGEIRRVGERLRNDPGAQDLPQDANHRSCPE